MFIVYYQYCVSTFRSILLVSWIPSKKTSNLKYFFDMPIVLFFCSIYPLFRCSYLNVVSIRIYSTVISSRALMRHFRWYMDLNTSFRLVHPGNNNSFYIYIKTPTYDQAKGKCFLPNCFLHVCIFKPSSIMRASLIN